MKKLSINLILLVTVIFIGYRAIGMIRQARLLYQEEKSVSRKIEELTKKKVELRMRVRELETPEAIEREAKARLNLKLPDEEMVIVVPPKVSVDEEPRRTFWQRIVAFLMQSVSRGNSPPK